MDYSGIVVPLVTTVPTVTKGTMDTARAPSAEAARLRIAVA
jgi:hypothetical protein